MMRKLSCPMFVFTIVASALLVLSFPPRAVAVTYLTNYGAPCNPTGNEFKDHKCFINASGYTFRIIEDGDGAQCGLTGTITGFPHKLVDGGNLWCYEIVATANAQAKPITHVDLQIPLAYYDFKKLGATAGPLLAELKNTINTTLGTQFDFSYASGCLGDSTTGFEIGDPLTCGAKWTLKLNPNSGAKRFYYKSPASVTDKVRVGPGILAPRLSTVFEPGILLGARDLLDAPVYTPQARYMCEQIEGNFYKITVDDFGCPNAIYDCLTNSGCTTGCNPLEPEIIRAKLVDKRTNTVIMPYATLREIGDHYGNRFCPAGHVTFTGSTPCSCNPIGGRIYCLPVGCTMQ